MAYGRRKKTRQVAGKSLISKMTEKSSETTTPNIVLTETPMNINQSTGYGAESGPPPETNIAPPQTNIAPPETSIAPPETVISPTEFTEDYNQQTSPSEEETTPPAIEEVTPPVVEEISEPPAVVSIPREQRIKKKKRIFRKPFISKSPFNKKPVISQTPIEPQPLPEPEIERVPIVKNLYDGANVRTFYGIEDTPIGEFINNVLKDVPLFKIDEIDQQGNVINTFQVKDKRMRGKKQKKSRKFSIIKGDIKGNYRTKAKQEQQSLTQIVEENRYNISVDGVPGQVYSITFIGLENPDEVPAYTYDDPPIVPIPASLPESYQNSANEGVEGLKDGRRCGNCIFYDPEVSICNKWNAEVRQYYWCLSWQTIAPIIAESNELTNRIVEDGDIYNYFLEKVKDPTTQEPNLSNFLLPFNLLFAQYGAYIYGDYLRRIVDSGDAFNYGDVPLNFFFTTQEGFLNAIDFINNANLTDFNDPPEAYDSIQQSLVTYTLTKKSTSTLPSNYPQTITINLHGLYYGEPKNILSQLDLTNAKIAYNPQLSVDSHHILKDNRFDLLQNAGSLNIDIVKQSVRERVLKFLVDNFKTYALNGQSSVKFIQWVANRSAFTETMQNLYQVLLSTTPISSDNQDILDAIQLSLSEQLFDEPSETEIPLGVSLVEVETQPEDEL